MSQQTKNSDLYTKLADIRANGGTVTYKLSDNSFIKNPVNPQVFKDEKGKAVPLNKVMEVFETTAHDHRAISFELN